MNSTFYIQQFLTSHPFVNEILNKNITATEIISALCVLDITEVIKVLNPLEAATRDLCDDFYVTSSVIIPMVHMLKNKIIQTNTIIISLILKVALIEQCQKRFSNIESVTSVEIAFILDPRFKKNILSIICSIIQNSKSIIWSIEKASTQRIKIF